MNWATNPKLMQVFPNYEDFLIWSEEIEESINKIEEYMSKPDAKVTKVVTRDPKTGKNQKNGLREMNMKNGKST